MTLSRRNFLLGTSAAVVSASIIMPISAPRLVWPSYFPWSWSPEMRPMPKNFAPPLSDRIDGARIWQDRIGDRSMGFSYMRRTTIFGEAVMDRGLRKAAWQTLEFERLQT